MKTYPEYKYYIVCKTPKEKWDKFVTEVDSSKYTMQTMMLYNSDAINHIKKEKSLKGFYGPKRATHLIVDFDNHGQDPCTYLKKRDQLISYLMHDFSYDSEIWTTCSKKGSTLRSIVEDPKNPSGLHIKLPFSHEIEPCIDIHHKLKFLANKLFGTSIVDNNIYSEHRLIRVENSIRENGFGKFQIGKIENRKQLNPSLLTGYTQVKTSNKVDKEVIHNWHKHPLINRCLVGTIPIGKRHAWISSSCRILKESGFSRDQVEPVVLAMLSNCHFRNESDNPLNNDSLDRIVSEHF